MIDIASSFSSTLKLAKGIQVNCSILELSNQARKQLEDIYVKFLGILEQKGKQSSLKIALSSIPEADFQDWYEYATKILRKMATRSTWLRMSTIHEDELLMLQISIQIMRVFDALKCAFEKDYFSALASLVDARKAPNLPCAEVAETVCWTVQMALCTVSTQNPKRTSKSWSGNKLFKEFESCGLLVQFVRCSASYPAEGVLGFGEEVLTVYEAILQDKPMIGWFQKGQPCGDTANAILKGTDGHALKSKKVVGYLQTISKMAEIVNDSTTFASTFDEKGKRRMMCRHCNKAEDDPNFQLSLKSCAGCKQAFYCSRECQKKDWKAHKRNCKTLPLSDTKASGPPAGIASNFIHKNTTEMLANIAVVCIETGTKPCDIIVLIDTEPGKDGSTAPAFKEPPEFRTLPFRELLRENKTQTDDTRLSNECIRALKMHQSNRTSDQLLSVLKYPGKTFQTKHRARLPSGYEMFGTEVVKAFIEFLYCGRFGLLAQIYPGHDQEIAIKHILCLPMTPAAHEFIRRNPNHQEEAREVCTMVNLKRFGGTDKSIPKVGNVKEDVERMFGTSTRSA